MKKQTGKCIIIAAGRFREAMLQRSEADLVIACDAGYRYCLENGITPDLIVGDFDSALKEDQPAAAAAPAADGGGGDAQAAIDALLAAMNGGGAAEAPAVEETPSVPAEEAAPEENSAPDGADASGMTLYQQIEAFEREHPACVRRLPEVKDDTDTIYAAKIGIEEGFRRFEIYGALGGDRISHTIANIQTLLYLKRQGAGGELIDQGTRIRIIENEQIAFPPMTSGVLSLFAVGGTAAHVTIKGCQYELNDATIANDFPAGVSNAFVFGQAALIGVQDGALIVVTETQE